MPTPRLDRPSSTCSSAALLLAILGGAVVACAPDPSTPASPEAGWEVEVAPAHGAPAHAAGAGSMARQLAELRRVTAPFHNFALAERAGYGAQLTSCWYHRELGAMGYHYGNPGLINGTVGLLEPEILIYEPGPAGQLKLVGLEYIVPIDAWEGTSPPSLLGHDFHRNEGLGIFALHLWLWRNNPEGMFEDWNPMVSCVHAQESEDRAP